MFLAYLSRARSYVIAVFFFALSGMHVAVQGAAAESDKVSLSESSITWSTVKYEMKSDGRVVSDSLDLGTIVDRTFKTRVLENKYLKVTLLPEFGGRILSIVYKPTGHEQLYRTEVGIPYGIGAGNFYYDWLMVYGGIFPTFPDSEHGKTWLKPWDFKIVKQAPDEVTVAMSLKDDFEYTQAPRKFLSGWTDIEATYFVTLRAGRAAVDTRVLLKNPSDDSIKYEYWTCTTLAPGSDLQHPKTTGGAEIIAPIEAYVTADWSTYLTSVDKGAGFGKTRFQNLRFFKNWSDMGIAYAAPDMGGANFWGVINHDNEEGIIRIADNTLTPGLKMWTWGFPSFTNETDPRKKPNEVRPYIELWAGVSDQFFHRVKFPPKSEKSIPETYSPTVGLKNVTHASSYILANLTASATVVDLQFFSIEPAIPLTVVLKRGETVLFSGSVKADPKNGNHLSAAVPADSKGESVQLTIKGTDGKELLQAQTALPK